MKRFCATVLHSAILSTLLISGGLGAVLSAAILFEKMPAAIGGSPASANAATTELTPPAPTQLANADSSDVMWSGPLNEAHLVGMSQSLIAETNLLRADPAAYAQFLAQMRPYYDGLLLQVPGQPIAIQTREGVRALDEAIAVLQSTPPLPPMSASTGMSQGAADHASDIGSAGLMGHTGSDQSSPFDRMNRYGRWRQTAGENISFSSAAQARWHIIQLLIDDGVSNRGHRDALLATDYRYTGAACNVHSVFRVVCVMNYAGGYEEAR